MIIVKRVKNQNRVYFQRRLAGTLREFCCGIEFRPKDCPGALFSILGVKYGSQNLIDSIKALLSIKIPNKDFHWNFSPEIAKNETKLRAYEAKLNAN